MNPELISAAEPEMLEIEDELADFTADLLALEENELILKHLFEYPLGCWSDLGSALSGYAEMAQALASLQSECGGTLRATWLEHPDLDGGYCLVLFYVDALGWNNLALYNKARLEAAEKVAC